MNLRVDNIINNMLPIPTWPELDQQESDQILPQISENRDKETVNSSDKTPILKIVITNNSNISYEFI